MQLILSGNQGCIIPVRSLDLLVLKKGSDLSPYFAELVLLVGWLNQDDYPVSKQMVHWESLLTLPLHNLKALKAAYENNLG